MPLHLDHVVMFRMTGEHEHIERVGDEVWKHLRPEASLDEWREREYISQSHPDLFVPFRLVERIAVQPFVLGENSQEWAYRILAECLSRGLVGISDIGAENVIGRRAVDFRLAHHVRRRTDPMGRRFPLAMAEAASAANYRAIERAT